MTWTISGDAPISDSVVPGSAEFKRADGADAATAVGIDPAGARSFTVPPRSADPLWTRVAFFGLLAATAIAYAWHLSDSGWANSYYAAAVQAGTKSWKAMLFGSTDASNFITVDKSPASLWPMEIMARIFGMNSWSMLLPQAIEGVAAVAILHATIRRWFGTVAGLIAALVMAATPVAAMMFRFNNPDALLTLCLIASAYFVTRAIEDGATKWMVACGSLVGFAFLAKELQAFLVLPAFAVAYLLAGPGRIARRIGQGLAMAVAMSVSAGWWIAALMLTPAGSRPYVGGSTNNSFWNVLFGYNGLGRLSGKETGSVVAGGGQGQPGSWGTTGPGRMFRDQWATQISWLLPTALALLAIGLGYSLLRSRDDKTRAGLIVWGGWLVVTGTAFSFGKGIIHEYYAVALAPAIGAVIGIGTTVLWRARAAWLARGMAAGVLILTGWWTQHLMGKTVNWFTSLHQYFIPLACVLGVAFVVSGAWLRRALPIVASAGFGLTLFAPVAATATTVRTAHSGPIPIAGPASTGGRFGGGGPGGRFLSRPGVAPNFGGGGIPNGGPPAGFPNFGGGGPGGLPNVGGAGPGAGGPGAGGPGAGGPGAGPGAGGPGAGGPGAGGPGAGGPGASIPNFGAVGGAGPGGLGGGRGGGLLSAAVPGKTLTAMLRLGGTGYRWTAASIGAMTAAGYQLATDEPVMAIGGFNGNDPAPSLAQFQQYVANHSVHYFISGGRGFGGGFGGAGFGGAGFGGGGNGATRSTNPTQTISAWVTNNFTAKIVDGITVYDLSQTPDPHVAATNASGA